MTNDEKKKLQRERDELKNLRKVCAKNDSFYDKISEDQAKHLKDKVLTLVRENYAERSKDPSRAREFSKKF